VDAVLAAFACLASPANTAEEKEKKMTAQVINNGECVLFIV
jgi:hypothetical protein